MEGKRVPGRGTLKPLIVIPCSGSKQRGSAPCGSLTLASMISQDLAGSLEISRASIREQASVDRTRMPAYLRYTGELYRHGADAIAAGVADGHEALIISGAYGVVRADEGIAWYDKRLRLLDWPRGMLESCILDYARRQSVSSILAVVARTSPYATLMRGVAAIAGSIRVRILSPVIGAGEGAQGKVPRAQGQAVAQILGGDWTEDWRSSDGLTLAPHDG